MISLILRYKINLYNIKNMSKEIRKYLNKIEEKKRNMDWVEEETSRSVELKPDTGRWGIERIYVFYLIKLNLG